MTAQSSAVEQFREFAQSALCGSVTVGLLPQNGGTAVRIVTGARTFTSLSRKVRQADISLDVLSKGKNQSEVYGGLCQLAGSCDSADWELPVYDVQAKEPVFVGKDGDFWIYSLAVILKIMI